MTGVAQLVSRDEVAVPWVISERLERVIGDRALGEVVSDTIVVVPRRIVRRQRHELVTVISAPGTWSGALLEPLVAVRIPSGCPEGADLVRRIALEMLDATLDSIETVLETAVRRLGERTFADRPLSRMQLVQGSVADSVVALEYLRSFGALVAARARPLRDLWPLGGRLHELEWEVVRLLGAHGYEQAGHGHQLLTARRTYEAWLAAGSAAEGVAC